MILEQIPQHPDTAAILMAIRSNNNKYIIRDNVSNNVSNIIIINFLKNVSQTTTGSSSSSSIYSCIVFPEGTSEVSSLL